MKPYQATWFDIVVVVLLAFGLFIWFSDLLVEAGFDDTGFRNADFLQMLLMELVLGGATLMYLQLRHFDIHGLFRGYEHFDWLRALLLCGVIIFVSQWLIAMMPDVENQPVYQIMQNTPSLSVPLVLLASLVNGIYEELFLLGFIQRVLSASGVWFAIGVSMVVRLLYHTYQGPMGVLFILLFGLILSLYFWKTARLWPVMLAHVLVDVMAFI